ncbi:PDR/VanB family oxidoreductase [Pseudomonas bharatica]|uniref:PDR/VanB family oxidoreductase n=1 Tax=Pseudomonas bharatica TaxID=2692112 RepID=UPI003B28C34F
MMELLIKAMRLEGEDIVGLELVREDGAPLPAFTAGAHIDVHLDQGLVRQYSLCNDPHEQHRYCIGVLHDAASRGGSRAVHQRLRVGQRVTVSEPRNLFALDSGAGRSLLFAGGIGITPILAMAHSLAREGRPFAVHYSARSAQRAAFLDQLGELPARCYFDDGQRLDLATVLANEPADTHLYVCGPAGYIDHVLEGARALGWDESRLHREYFGAAPLTHAEDAAFEVRIHATGQVFEVPADRSITQVLDDAGIIIPVSCEQGICGTCITRVVDGEVDHRDQFLTAEERRGQMTPCCSRARGGCLVLDL